VVAERLHNGAVPEKTSKAISAVPWSPCWWRVSKPAISLREFALIAFKIGVPLGNSCVEGDENITAVRIYWADV